MCYCVCFPWIKSLSAHSCHNIGCGIVVDLEAGRGPDGSLIVGVAYQNIAPLGGTTVGDGLHYPGDDSGSGTYMVDDQVRSDMDVSGGGGKCRHI